MKKIFLFLNLLIFINLFSQRQYCGSSLTNNQVLALNDKIDSYMATSDYISALKADKTVTIPVVFHIVYHTDTENVSLDRIQSQLDVLNRDFNYQNTDVFWVPSQFKKLIANMNIKFVLDTILRVHTDSSEFYSNIDNIKFSDVGGSNAIDTKRNLNIWVGALENGLLGYSSFPGEPEYNDGVVLDYRAFGVYFDPDTANHWSLGRTAVHEVGHWLGLFHIWGDDCYWFTPAGYEPCAGSDYVGDTPNAGCPHWGCPPAGTKTCNSLDMYMNYMDYTDNNCMVMFTKGQKARSRATFQVFRKEIYNGK